MMPDVVLNFSGGLLRSLVPVDVHPGYVDGLNDPEVNRYLDGVKSVKQTKQAVIDFVSADAQSGNAVLWGIWRTGADSHVGTVRIHGIEHRHRTAHIGVCLFDKTSWGKGLGQKAIQAATQWALEALNLRWIEAGAYEKNIASQRAFVAAGYAWVYDVSGKYLLDGVPVTVKFYAACNDESKI